MPDDSWYNEGVDWSYDDLITVTAHVDYSVSDAVNAYGTNDGANDDDGGGGDEPITPSEIEQRSVDYANKAVVRSTSFDPNNPNHVKIETQLKDTLKAAFAKAIDGNSNSDFTLKNGHVVTDNDAKGLLESIKIEIGTDSTFSGGVAVYLHGSEPLIQIDIDHPEIQALASNFESFNEAINFILAHEIGHALDVAFGDGRQPGGSDETDAHRYAEQLLNAYSIEGPSQSELQQSYPNSYIVTNAFDDSGQGEISDGYIDYANLYDFNYGFGYNFNFNFGNWHFS
jgi:hypothetical protein